MNSFQKTRAESIKKILLVSPEPGHIQDLDQLVAELLQYLDKEISAAFGRGIRHSKRDPEEIQDPKRKKEH